MLSTFGVRVCRGCARAPEHALVSKTEAKSRFLLSDKDLAPLACLRRKLATHSRDGFALLYEPSQCAEVAQRKHGSAELLEAKREAQQQKRVERKAAAKKRSQAEAQATAAATAAEAAAVAAAARGGGRAAAGVLSASAPAKLRRLVEPSLHAHVYASPPEWDEKQQQHRRVCDTCGFVSFVDIM